MKIPKLSLRTKITLSFLIIIVFGGLLSLFFGFRLIKNTLISQAQTKVNHDLAAAWMVYNEKLSDVRGIVGMTAARESLHEDIRNQNLDVICRILSRAREDWGLDFLNLMDQKGTVIVRCRNPEEVGDDRSQDEIVQKVMNDWETNQVRRELAHTQIVPREELLYEGEDLAEKAYFEFIPTPKAAERPEEIETSGLMLKAAAVVVDESDNLLGILYGGILLNRNYDIVDRVKEIIFKGEKYKGIETGTATIFQQDLRISTNVRNIDGTRAIGTRVSKEVNTAVLQEGKPWNDRAFVVNDWYITAYEPIRNVRDEIIGILYVGTLEKPYLDIANRVMATFILIASLCVVLLLVMLSFTTTRIIDPLKKIVEATKKIAKGDLSHKVEVTSRDEIGYLAISFNKMTSDLRAANVKLLDWGKTLEKKVEERTRELTKMQASLIQSEKLASLGKLAAGVAHEINNPLGGVLIYSHLLLEDTPKGSPNYISLKKIVKETSRCKDIVKGLLEFARPKDPEMSPIDINHIVEQSLYIIEGQSLFQNIRIEKDFTPDLPRIVGDGAQLQQVFMNIILNAAEAMDSDGTLSLRTELGSSGRFINIHFSDTGHGIAEEDIKRLFEPFFTTKEVGKGTGLGLAISYSIIRKHQGTIEVTSAAGPGATFVVKLPIERKTDDD
jgi:two-component system NtrC family sensor kinase